jgi:hypothetical protein
VSLSDDDRVRVAAGVHVREFDGELIVLDLERGDYFGLDEIGARAWAELTRGRSPRQVAAQLSSEYNVDEARALADVRSLVGKLLERGLVTAEGGGDR